MSTDELIAKGREHISNFSVSGGGKLSSADFPKANLRETALACFESDARTDRVYVFLERETGKSVTAFHWAVPGRAL